METYYATPDPSLLLSSDGILITRAPGFQFGSRRVRSCQTCWQQPSGE